MNPTQLLEHFDRISEAPDAVPRLRRFILDLAVRGKLVAQDPNDEPARELRDRLLDSHPLSIEGAKRKVGRSTMRTIQRKVPFKAPIGWDWAIMGELGETNIGLTYSPLDVAEEGIPVLRSNNIKDGKLVPSGLVRVNMQPRPNAMAQVGDMLICARNGSKALVGKSALITELSEPMAFGAFMAIFRSSINPYLQIFLASPLFRSVIDEVNTNTINQLTQSNLKSTLVSLPPLAEQHRIVAKVDELMALCDQLEKARAGRELTRDRLVASSLQRLNQPDEDAASFREHVRFTFNHLPQITTRLAHIKQLRQTILNLAIRGKLVEQDPNDEPADDLLKSIQKITGKTDVTRAENDNERSFALPSGWAWSVLGFLATKTGSGSTPRGGQAVYKSAGIPFLRSQNVYNDGLRLNDVAFIDEITHERMRGTSIEKGDLLLNITGGSIGRCCRIPAEPIQANISQHVAIIRPAVSGMSDFMHKVMLSPFFQSFVIDEQTGAGRGGLPKNRMDQIPIPLPPLAEQHRIVAKVDELMALCDQLEAQLTNTEADQRRLLDALLHEALNGVTLAA